jgi:hypothetical protein
MRLFIFARRLFFIALILTACRKYSGDLSGPEISEIKTSNNVLVISDCSGTSVDITARVTDPSGVDSVSLWYRVADQPFASTSMPLKDDAYQVTLSGTEFLGKGYGILEFYIQAKDGVGNLSKSQTDTSIQFLPCVNN